MSKQQNLLGRVFTRLTVIQNCSFNKKMVWTKCCCGKEISILVKRQYLFDGDKKSCGCLQKETMKTNAYKVHKSNRKYSSKKEELESRRKRFKIKYQANPEKYKQEAKKSFQKNKANYYKSVKIRMKTDITFRLKHNLRGRLRKVLGRENNRKKSKTTELIGCTLDFFKNYISKLFEPGMSWKNYGPKTWHLDHIIPLSHFDLTCEEQIKKAMHYTNFQPMWAEENASKGNRYIGKYKKVDNNIK